MVGRGSSQADQEVMLNKWQADFSGLPVHGKQAITPPVQSICPSLFLSDHNFCLLLQEFSSTIIASLQLML